MSALNLFDILITLCGLYLAISGLLMKTSGKINSNLVLTKNVNQNQIKDKEGFINYIWLKLFICGILCAFAGIFNMIIFSMGIDDKMAVFVDLGVNAVFFILLLIYGLFAVKAQKMFIDK